MNACVRVLHCTIDSFVITNGGTIGAHGKNGYAIGTNGTNVTKTMIPLGELRAHTMY